MDIAEEAGVPVSGTVRLTRDPTDAILNTVEQRDSDGVLLGWGGSGSPRRDIVLGSTVDDVAREAAADVFVEKVGAGDGEVDSILLPWADSTHAELAAGTAARVARSTGASIDVVRVAGDEDREDAAEILTDAESVLEGKVAELDETTLDFETRMVEAESVEDALVEEADDHDLTTLGATREGILQQFVFGSVPEAVAERVGATAIVCQREVGVDSRLKRLLS